MQLCGKEQCTGCTACFNACYSGAITMEQDNEGFLRPTINQEKCIDCGLCEKACPEMNRVTTSVTAEVVYACWSRDKKVRKASTSGGAFTACAHAILEKNGVIFGAGFDENNRVIHKAVETKTALDELRGSKYVQSEIGATFQQVKKALQEEKKVLYSGTPCQISGLYAYLGERFPGQLWTIDLVCHGVPSPKIYRSYLDYLEEKYESSVQQIYFRNKNPGWAVFSMKVIFANGQVYEATTYEDPYARGFLRNYYLRPSCHNCQYANIYRVADITLADFWGYQETCRKERDWDRGVSLVMLNSPNGEALFAQIKGCLNCFPRAIEQAVAGNRALRESFPAAINREDFWKDYTQSGSFETLIDKYLYPEKDPWLPNVAKRYKEEDRQAVWLRIRGGLFALLGENGYNRLKSMIRRLLRRG